MSLNFFIHIADKDNLESILALHEQAFGESEGKEIGKLVHALMTDSTAEPVVPLIALAGDILIGHVIFSKVKVGDTGGMIMAPLAVLPDYQSQGVGKALIEFGIKTLGTLGVPFFLVLGDPNYYSRFGFSTEHSIKAPHKLPYPEAWMALELTPGGLSGVRGTAICADCLMAPEYW